MKRSWSGLIVRSFFDHWAVWGLPPEDRPDETAVSLLLGLLVCWWMRHGAFG
jgi:hypothetical protein